MFEIELTQSARRDLKVLRKFEQKIVLDGIEDQLRFEPTAGTLNRKCLEPNDISDWELRVGRYRVFYSIEEHVVEVRAVGFKLGNELYIRGEKREL